MSVLSEAYRSRSLSSRRSASLHRKRNLRQEFSWYGDDCYSPMNTLRSSVRSQTLSLRGGLNGKPSAIDPELRDARKQGNRYNIAMNLNALLDFPMTDNAILKHEKRQKSLDYNSLAMMHRSLSSPYSLHHSSRSRMTPVVRSADTGGRKSVITIAKENVPTTDSFRLSTLKSETKMLARMDDAYAIRSVRASSTENIPQVIKQRSASDEGYVIRSVTPNSRIRESVETEYNGDESVSFDLQLIGTDSLRSKTSRTTRQSSDHNPVNSEDVTDGTTRIGESGWNDKAENDGPSISMTINETMTMDYYQPEETKGSLNRNSLPKQLKGSRPTNSKATTRQSEKDRNKTRPRPKSSLLQSAAPALATAHEAESRQSHRKRQKSAPVAKPERREREPDKASRLHESPLQRHWSIDEVDHAGKVKNLDVLRQNRPRNVRDSEEFDRDFIFRENLDISPGKRSSFDRNVFGQSTRSTWDRQPTKGFSEYDIEIGRQQMPSVRSSASPIGRQQLPMSSRQTLFQRQELIPVETTTTTINNNTFNNNQCSDDEYQTQFEITRGLSGETRGRRSPIALPPLQPRIPTALTSTYVRQIMKDAPDGSFRQRMDVHREEEEGKFAGQLPLNRPGGGGGGASQKDSMADLLNVDLVSEKVDMKLIDGVAQLVVTVTCERIVPIHGSVDLYKKTSIVVRRCIDVDLTVTEERKKIYDEVMKNRLPSGKLSSKDTFELYIAFMEVAELHPSPGLDQEQLWIDRKVDEEKVGKYTSLEKKLSEGSEFTARNFGAGQQGVAEARRRFMSNRNAASSPASTYSLSQSYQTSPIRSYSNYYGGSNYATVLPSSGYQATSYRWKSGNDVSSTPVQFYDTSEVSRRMHEDEALNADGRDERFADETVLRRDDGSRFAADDDDGEQQLQVNKDNSVKISGQETSRGNADELFLGGVGWSKSTASNEYGRDVGLSGRSAAIKEPEQADRSSLSRSQERIREIGEEPGYQVLSGEGKQGGEYSVYEELKPKEENESRYNEPMHRESNGQHSRLSGFSRYGKTSLIC